MKKIQILFGLFLAMLGNAYADDAQSFKSVEDSLRAMDKNHDGMVTVDEVRASIELAHGKGYQKEVLDELESPVNSRSCASPFSKSFF